MSRQPTPWRLSRKVGSFALDRRFLALLLLLAAGLTAKAWLQDHPEHNPWAPLDLRDPPGWATGAKLSALADDPAQCRAVLERSDVTFSVLDPVGEGACRREDRTVLAAYPYASPTPATTCPVAVALELWLERGVQPAARAAFGQGVARIEHYGAYSCRRLYGRGEGPWSEHATGNALDVSGFVLEDGTRISVLNDWSGEGEEATFLRSVRDAACAGFSTVLSPDYNEAHRDHFHFDRAPRAIGGVCR